jgi:2-methylcitrate dehydratase PrpD
MNTSLTPHRESSGRAGRQLSLTDRLSEFVREARWEDIPATVRHEAKRSLVNYFAVALAGGADPTIDKAVGVYGRFRAGSDAGLIGRPERTDILNAAALNAMSANVYDFDDTHLPTIIHPTAPVAAALFALAESSHLSGAQLLLAFILGVEVECRLGNAISPGHYQRGWHITSTCGVFGAAAGAAKAMNLDARRIAWAFGNASAQSSGLVETLGTMSKSISVGNAARNGLLSALLAADDFSGPDQPLEGERGFLRVMGERPNLDALSDALGEDWALLSNTYKPYPCGVVLNPVIEACLELSRQAGWSIADIERIELVGHPLLRERTDRPGVRSGRESQVSAQHSVAVALVRGRAGLAEFSDASVADPALKTLGSRLVFVDDPGYQVAAAKVTVVLRSGRILSRMVEAARGSLGVPLTDMDLEAKLRELAEYGAFGRPVAPLIDALWTLDSATDAAAPMRLARGVVCA